MHPALVLLALTLLSAEIDVLVLRSGHQIPVTPPVTVRDGTVVFRNAAGVLYSLPLSEIDLEATEKFFLTTSPGTQPDKDSEGNQEVKHLRVSAEEKERLLRDLQNSRGVPAPPGKTPEVLVAELHEEVDVREQGDESSWRAESKRLEENVRRRQEEIELLKVRIRRLEDTVLALMSFGLSGDQFGYQMMQLQDAKAMLEQARLGLSHAQRELDDFRERARRQGILPGWLR